MRDDRLDVEPCFEEPGQPIPRAEETPSRNAVHPNTFENNFVGEIERDRSGRNAEKRHPSAVLDGAECLVQGAGMAGHFQRGVDAFSGGDLANRRRNLFGCLGFGVQHVVCADLFGEVEAIVAHIRGNDRRRPGGSGDGGRE